MTAITSLEQLRLLRSDLHYAGRELFRVRDKAGEIRPFLLNDSQTELHRQLEEQRRVNGWVRALILKGRQMGISTYIAVRYYHQTSMRRGINTFILSHEQTASDTLFGMVDRIQRNNPLSPHVGTSNVKELEFDKLDSSYAVATAGNKATGRSKAITLYHGSEVAYWTNAQEHFSSSVQTVPLLPGTEILLESTSSGASGDFYERYLDAEAGRGDYLAIFLPWWLDNGYQRDPGPGFVLSQEAEPGFLSEQEYADTFKLPAARMAWRRAKIIELRSNLLFQREYPADSSEAWTAPADHEPFIGALPVIRARKRTTPAAGPLIIGVDPASGGGDRFAIAARRGMRVLWVRHRNKINHLEAAAWIKEIVDTEQPARVNIDAGNIGAAVITQLKSINPQLAELVRGVDFGAKSQAKLARPMVPGPQNRRAEMYLRMKDWLESEEGAAVPDMPELQADVTAPKQRHLPNNDFGLETKKDMKARGVRSTDLSDAVALTFASNEYFKSWTEPGAVVAMADIDHPVNRAQTQFNTPFVGGGSTGWMA